MKTYGTDWGNDEAVRLCVGLDIGKRRVAIGWPYWEYSATFDMEGYRWSRQMELFTMREWLTARLPKDIQLWAELPYLSSGPHANATTTAELAATLGALQSAQTWLGFETTVPSQWKAKTVGKGNATKEETQAWLAERYPRLFEAAKGEENAVDAMCIGLYGIMRTTGEVGVPIPTRRKARGKASSGRGTA